MPQIPVYTPNQRIDASTPVAAIDTRSARMGGEAADQFGQALSSVGNILQQQAVKLGAEIDRGLVKKERNAAVLEMMTKANETAMAEIEQEDDPSGIDGVNRFRESIKESIDARANSLPERLRGDYYVAIADEELKYSGMVLAKEIEKREKLLPALRQENINQVGAIVRTDPSQTDVALSQLQEDLTNDQMLSEGQRQMMLKSATQNTVKSAIGGLTSRNNWVAAEKMLQDPKYSKFFSADELDKEVQQLRAQKSAFVNDAWNNETRARTRENAQAEKRKDDLIQLRLTQMQLAGTDQSKLDPIMMQIDMDFSLSTAEKNRMKDAYLERTTNDSIYTGRAFDEFMKNPDQTMNSVRSARGTDSISMAGGTQLLQQMTSLKSAMQNPSVKMGIEENQKYIESFKQERVYDSASKTYRESDDMANQQARRTFMAEAAKMAEQGTITSSGLRDLAVSTLKSQYSNQVNPLPVDGVSAEQLVSQKTIQDTLVDLNARYAAKEFNTPEKRNELEKKLQGLKANMARARMREELAKHANKETGR